MRDDEDHVEGAHEDRRMSLLGAAAWTFTVGLLSQLAVMITESSRPGAQADLVNLTACVVLAHSLVLFGILRVHSPNASLRDVLGLRPTSIPAAILAAAGGAALYPALDVIDDFMEKRYPSTPEEAERLAHLLNPTTVHERVILLVSSILVLPIFEELLFRGALFRGLRRARPEGLAVVAAAALYGVALGDPRSLPTAFVLGLFLAWLRGRSGSAMAAIAAHVAYAVVPLVPVAMGHEIRGLGPKVALVGAVACAALTWGAGVIYARDARAERCRLLDA
jgi:membrane protease YdiL (CAAX protease family)